jgi:HK97 family phage major capsid protein
VNVDSSAGTLVGRPVITSEELPGVISGSPQSNVALCGDLMAAFELTEIGGLSILRDPYSTHGVTTFYIAARFGGIVTDNNAVKVLRA